MWQELFKGKHIDKNWTFLGDIFIKKSAASLPLKKNIQDDFGPLPPNLIPPRQNLQGPTTGGISANANTLPTMTQSQATPTLVPPRQVNYQSTNAEASQWASQFTGGLPAQNQMATAPSPNYLISPRVALTNQLYGQAQAGGLVTTTLA